MRPTSSDRAPSIASCTGSGRARGRCPARKRAQRLGDGADPFGHRRRSSPDCREAAPPCPRRGTVGVLGIGADGRHRLVDLVRHAGRDLPERWKAGSPGQDRRAAGALLPRRVSRSAISAASAALAALSSAVRRLTRRSRARHSFAAAPPALPASAPAPQRENRRAPTASRSASSVVSARRVARPRATARPARAASMRQPGAAPDRSGEPRRTAWSRAGPPAVAGRLRRRGRAAAARARRRRTAAVARGRGRLVERAAPAHGNAIPAGWSTSTTPRSSVTKTTKPLARQSRLDAVEFDLDARPHRAGRRGRRHGGEVKARSPAHRAERIVLAAPLAIASVK